MSYIFEFLDIQCVLHITSLWNYGAVSPSPPSTSEPPGLFQQNMVWTHAAVPYNGTMVLSVSNSQNCCMKETHIQDTQNICISTTKDCYQSANHSVFNLCSICLATPFFLLWNRMFLIHVLGTWKMNLSKLQHLQLLKGYQRWVFPDFLLIWSTITLYRDPEGTFKWRRCRYHCQ
jgi:hypothetical protein